MKRTVPLLIAACCGVVLIITAFIPATVSWGETATVWFDILAAIAFVLGGGNLLKIHLKKVSDRAAGWAYSLITVLAFLITLTIGLTKWSVPPATDQERYGETFATLPLDDLPKSLTFTEQVDLDAKYAREELPDSVKRQLQLKQENDRIVSLIFRGWMKPGQAQELLAAHQNLEWQSAIESLAEKAAVPKSMRGKVIYHADHEVLSAAGVLTENGEKELLAMEASDNWDEAVRTLTEKTHRKTTFQLREIPAHFKIPEQFAGQVKLVDQSLELTGPLTPAMQNAFTNIFPRSRPMSKKDAKDFVQKVATLDGGLTKEQKQLFTALLGVSWNADQLIAVLDEAGKSKPVIKTYRELLKEKQSGVRELEPTKPSTAPDIKLNKQQIKFIRDNVDNQQYDLGNLAGDLKERGDWNTSQQQALGKFLQKAPTIGARNKLICLALTKGKSKLSEAQYSYLLEPYRVEHLWNGQIYDLLVKSHEVKYPWSGAYLQTGSPFWFAYEYAFKPLTATMFSLLAFYVASAAFRAFRAKNFEAFLLLGTAFIVLLGRTFAGAWLSSLVPDTLPMLRVENITIFIMSVVNTAGNRAIMIGISLGIVSTSLKILLGVDRSYLGSGED